MKLVHPILAATILLPGCGGSGGTGENVGGSTEFKPNVHGLADGTVLRTNARDESVTLTNAPQSLKSGDIIVATDGEGILKRVKSVARSRDGSTAVEVGPASMEEAFSLLDIRPYSGKMGGNSTWKFRPAVSGVRAKAPSRGIVDFSLQFDRFEAGPGLETNGSVDFQTDLEFDIDLDITGLKKLHCVPIVNVDGTLKIDGRAQGNVNVKKFVGEWTTTQPLKFGWVVVQPVLKVYSQVSGDIYPGLGVECRAGATLRAGVHLENENWDLIGSVDPRTGVSFYSVPVGKVSAKWSVIRVEPILKFWGVVGPYGGFDVPAIEGTIEKNGRCVRANIDALAAASFGVKIEAFRRVVVDVHWDNVFNRRWNLANGDFNCTENAPPTAFDGSGSVSAGENLHLTLTGNDPEGSPLGFRVTSGPAFGSLSGVAPSMTYTPNPGYSGSDQFRFVVSDGDRESNEAVYSILVRPPGGGGGGTTLFISETPLVGQGQIGYSHWGTPSNWRSKTDCGWDSHYYFTWSSAGGPPDNVGQWRPNIGEARSYEVFAFIPFCEGRTSDARYEIWIGNIHTNTVSVNQLAKRDEWVSLGTYHFPNGTGSWIELKDVTNENDYYRIVHDAVKLEPR